MHWTLLCLWTCCCLTASISTPPTKDLPPDWPPLPDFKHHVDYVKWLQDRLSVPPEDDARPLWNEIIEQESDSEQVKQTKKRMWARDDNYVIHGLFTGDDPTPDRYAWDPEKHPQWETAYQAHLAAGLPAKLAAIAQRKRASQPLWFSDPKEWLTSQPAGQDKLSESQIDPGLTADDRLVINTLLPSLAPVRFAVRVVLQDAWRAPNGEVSADAMQGAMLTSLGIANQSDSTTLLISNLVSIAIRSLVYDSALRALRDNVFDPTQLAATNRILTAQDNRDLIQSRPDAVELADILDILQFIYRPQSDGKPKPDMNRLKRLAKFLAASHQNQPIHTEAPFDIVERIDRCDPQTAIRQVTDLFIQMREASRKELPQVADDEVERLVKEFKADPANHILARQFVWSPHYSLLQAAKREAQRRATLLLYALHIQHNRTGEWPATLQGIVGVPRSIRIDPFSGKDFCYRVENGQPLLYSVAFNGKDDGGKHDELWGHRYANSQPATLDADYVFWPIQPRRR